MRNHYKYSKCPQGSFPYTIKSGDTLYKLAKIYNTTVEDIMRLNPGINPKNLQIGQRICIGEEMQREKCPKGTFEYVIKEGDTFYFLSIRYSTTVEEIMAVNPGVKPEKLQIGQKICIPKASSYPEYPNHRDDRYYRRPKDDRDDRDDRYYKEPEDYRDDKYHKEPVDYRDDKHHREPRDYRDDKCYRDPTDYRDDRHHRDKKDKCDGSFYIIKPGDTLYDIANKYKVRVSEILKENPDIDPNNLKVGQLICIPESDPCDKKPIRKPYKY